MTPIRVILDGAVGKQERIRRAVEIAECEGCRNVVYEQTRRKGKRAFVWLRGDVPEVRRWLIFRRQPEYVVYGPHKAKP